MKSIQEVVDFLTKRMLNERNLDSKSDYRKKKKKKKKEEEEERNSIIYRIQLMTKKLYQKCFKSHMITNNHQWHSRQSNEQNKMIILLSIIREVLETIHFKENKIK